MHSHILRRAIVVLVLLVSVMGFASSAASPPAFVVRSEFLVDAPPAEVWRVLADFDDYPRWNPYAVEVIGTPTPGVQLALVLVDRNFEQPLRVTVTMVDVEPLEGFIWKGRLGVPGIVDTRHHFVLESLHNGAATRFIQFEEFRGLLSWLIPNREGFIANTQAAFDSMGLALQSQFDTATKPAENVE